jgi:hypothetical protein
VQTLAGNRLLELHQTQEDNLILSKELGDLEVVTLICSAGLAFLYFKLDPVFFPLFHCPMHAGAIER